MTRLVLVVVGVAIAAAVLACGAGDSARPAASPTVHNTTATGVAATLPDSPAAQLVRGLVERRPARMSELEAIVGPIAMSFSDDDLENMGWLSRPRGATGEFTALVPRLRVGYAFDLYHVPRALRRDVWLETFTLEVRGDAAAAEAILDDKLGSPRRVVDGATSYAAYHPFYLARVPGAPDRFRLAWFAEVPRFAIPEPDPQARAAWLHALARRIETAQSVDEIDAFCKAAPPAAGIEIQGTLNRTANPYGRPTTDARDYSIKLVPPVRATVVAESFAWGAIVGVSHDVHRSSWHVERITDSWLPTSGATQQWQISATFDTRPHGGWVTRAGARRADANAVLVEDEIGWIAVEPRFK